MLLKAKERMSKYKNVDFFLNIPKNYKYNLVFCSQVLQNLTLDLSLIKSTRIEFLKTIFNNLLSGGNTIITTRYKKQTGYDDMYWYIDKNIMPKSLNHMENVVPFYKELFDELKSIGFIDIEYKLSNDTIYKPTSYFKNLLDDSSWRAADSFWEHVTRCGELNEAIRYFNNLETNNKLVEYQNEKEIKRDKIGHVIIIKANKP